MVIRWRGSGDGDPLARIGMVYGDGDGGWGERDWSHSIDGEVRVATETTVEVGLVALDGG
jgi:hypothetical protein